MNISNIIFNRIIMMNIFLWIIGFILFYFTKNIIYLFLVFYVFIFNEIAYNICGLDLYFGGDRTELAYSTGCISEIIGKELYDVNDNLTEGYFPDKTKLSKEEGEINRFEEFIRLLDIKEGDCVLDAGCGRGRFVKYLRSKNIDAYGITITKDQFKENTKNIGPYFYYGDYSVFQHELENKFDHIILPGSLEHPFGGNHAMESSYEYKFNKMRKMFSMMKKYFKNDSEQKKILSTCLHMNMKYKNSYELYIMERGAGWLYPPIYELSVADSLKAAGYDVLLNEDYSWHYYFTSVCDPTHFGYPRDIGTFFTAISMFLYPNIFFLNRVASNGFWMWMFDGKHHFRDDPQFSFIEDIDERPCTLFYTVAQCL